jgi:hypothetical protein
MFFDRLVSEIACSAGDLRSVSSWLFLDESWCFVMRNSIVLVLLALCGTSARSQGLLESVDEQALDDFSKMVTAPLELPEEYVVLARSETTLIDAKRGLSTSDRIYIFAERRGNGNEVERFSASGVKNFVEDRPRTRVWEQRLVRDDLRVRRWGTPIKRYATEQSEAKDATDEEKVIRRRAPHPYPIFYPVALGFEASLGRVNADYGNLMLDKFQLTKATISESRSIKSSWQSGSRKVLMTFDPKQGGRPVEIVYMGADIRGIKDNTKKIAAIHKIKWEKKVWKNGDSCWVPTQFRQTAKDPVNRKESELVCHLNWKECTDKSAIPEINDGDWREPARVLFNEDWSLDYPDWTQLASETADKT